MSQKRRNKGTRPFMRKPSHSGGVAREDASAKPDEVMQVGADALIEDQPEEEPREKQDEKTTADKGGENGHDAQGGDAKPGASMSLAEELAKTREERDSYLDLARRERADFDNYRKRIQREMQDIKRESLANFLKDFFGPLDDMDRVMQESQKNHSFESLVQGVRIMEENFWRTLAKAGVKKIDAKGKQFDPNLHEAMAAIPAPDVAPNTVVDVFENGYKLDDHILRPARVVVSRAPDA